MKTLKVIVSLICGYIFFYGIGSFFGTALKGKPDFTMLITALVAGGILALIVIFSLRSSKKDTLPKQIRKPERQELLEKYEKNRKRAKVVFTLLIVFIVVLYSFTIILPLGIYYGPKNMLAVSIVLVSFTVIACIILAVLYNTRYESVRVTARLLEYQGLTLEHCLEGMEKEEALTVAGGKIICGENAVIFTDRLLVIPYGCVLWIYRKNYSVSHINVASAMIFRTVDKGSFETEMKDAELLYIVKENRDKFPSELVIGYGREQRKKYNKARNQYKKKA